MHDLLILVVHVLVSVAPLLLGGLCAVIAESPLRRQKLIVSSPALRRASILASLDRQVRRLKSLFATPHRIDRLTANISTGTFFKSHQELVDRECRRPFS